MTTASGPVRADDTRKTPAEDNFAPRRRVPGSGPNAGAKPGAQGGPRVGNGGGNGQARRAGATGPRPATAVVSAGPTGASAPVGPAQQTPAAVAAPAAPPVAPRPALAVPQAIGPADVHKRHYGILASFVLTVIAPVLAAVFYLFAVADDQYASTVSFSVRSEDIGTSLGVLGGLSSLSGASSTDADVLYQFIQSQELVERVNTKLNLRQIYSRPVYDPVFAVAPDAPIEDLVAYWQRMVKIFYDRGTGLIEVRVQAFDPKDAQAIAQAIYDDSSAMINHLSAIGREDSTRYAKEDLARTEDEAKTARAAVTAFRSRYRIVDPSADVQGQMGLLNGLQQQLTAAVIELNLLRAGDAGPNDPRIADAERRVSVIEKLIEQERTKFGGGVSLPTAELPKVADPLDSSAAATADTYSDLLGQYEALNVDREFAEKAYLAARASYDTALAKAQRQSRYLAAHVDPTLAETARYPQRIEMSMVAAALLFAIWGVGMLVYYSVRDRR